MTTSDSRVTHEMVERAIDARWKFMMADPGVDAAVSMRAALEAALSAQAPSVAVSEIQTMLDANDTDRSDEGFSLSYFDGYRDALRNLISKAGRDE